MLLFLEDRREALSREVRDEIENIDLAAMTPLEALNFLNRLKDKLK